MIHQPQACRSVHTPRRVHIVLGWWTEVINWNKTVYVCTIVQKIWANCGVFWLTDWVEFSPYEIGMAKYGTFMSPDLFGSKFFMGTVVKKYEENPLHFLMGEMIQLCFPYTGQCGGQTLKVHVIYVLLNDSHSFYSKNGGHVSLKTPTKQCYGCIEGKLFKTV